MRAMYLNDQILAPPLPRLHLRAGSGGKEISLEVPASWRSSKGKQVLFCFVLVLFLFFFLLCLWLPHLGISSPAVV